MRCAPKKLLCFSAGALGVGAAGLAVVHAMLPGLLLDGYRVWQRRSAGFEPRSVRVGQWRIPYLDSAPESGQPVVLLLHGFGDTKDNLIELAEGLTGGYRLILPDLPGFGETAHRPQTHHGAELYITTVLGLLDRLELDTVHLAGYSMGGLVATRVAARAPQRVRSLMLLAPAGIRGERPSRVEAMIRAGQGNPLVYRDREEFERLLRLNFNGMPEIPGFAIRAVAAHGERRAEIYQQVFDQVLGDSDAAAFEQQVASLQMPVTLIAGDADQIVDPSAFQRWHQLQPEIELILLPGGSHALVHQQIEAVQEGLRRHLRTLSAI